MSNNNSVQLTPEQKARIEENRKIALERLKARNLKSAQTSTESSLKILPSKSTASSNRVNPYLKPPNSFKNTKSLFPSTVHSNPQSSSKKSLIPNQPASSTKCNFEALSDSRFIVKVHPFDERIVQEFRKIPSRVFHGSSTRNWSFGFVHYKELLKSLESLSNVTVVKFPEFFIKCIMEEIYLPDEACLRQIEPTLISTLLDFQKTGICFGISKNGRCMIGDDMGLGKTRQAIGIADFYRNDWPLLIITNASTRQFWAQEIRKLLPYLTFNDIHIIQGSKDCYDYAKVCIGAYSTLQGNIDDMLKMKFDVIIFDESHNLKTHNAKQTNNAQNLSIHAKRIIMLSGTPALSRPVELFTQLRILDRHFATYHQFTERYCNGVNTNFGWKASGSSNLEELNILLRRKFMIRRIKSEVFFELGAKNRELVILENYKSTSEINHEMEVLRSDYHNANISDNEKDEILLKWYHTTSQIKAYGCCVFLKYYLENNDEKILVFAHHIYMMNALCAELEKADCKFIRIDGSVTGDTRAERVEIFQSDPTIRVAVLSIRACNAGITLTASSNIIFCEFDWNPSTMIQAEARAHRIGQENEVKVYFLLAPDTVDHVIWGLLRDKQNKLEKAGLVDDVEHLAANVKKSKFDVKLIKYEEPQKETEKVDYFKDDDLDDEEFLKLVENLP